MPPGDRPAPAGNQFRPDIEGLRGLAILLVVLFHALPSWLSGGFIGVDVFFVISGFLITGLLVRELGSTGRISFANFYVRRVRRLLPAAALALGATFLLSALVISPLDLQRVAGDGVSAALSVANIRFAIADGDYFSAISTPSPFLHYWSLSVEEQFYLIWPALLLVAFRLGRGPRGVGFTIGLVGVVSLIAAVVVSDVAANWAFYSLPTRAWQLALGGLLAVLVWRGVRGARIPGVLVLLGWLGFGAILAAGATFDAGLAYPGLWAIVPTLGAVAIIAAGDRRLGPGLLLRTVPMRFLGRISYALYLWHWPLLILPAIAYGDQLPLAWRFGLVALAIVIATASTLLVEEPIRRGARLASGRRQAAVVAGLGMGLLVSVTVGLGAITWVTDEAIAETRQPTVALDSGVGTDQTVSRARPADAVVRVGSGRERPASARAPTATKRPQKTPTPAVLVSPSPAGEVTAATTRPTPTPKATATVKKASSTKKKRKKKAQPTPAPTSPPVIRLPADVRPSLWDASKDEEVLRRNGCLQAESVTVPKNCVFGATKSKFVVALVGDSHASHWFPALSRVAKKHHWRLVTFVKVSCPFTDIPVRNLRLKRVYRECARFNDNTVAALRRLKPDLVITAQFRFQYPIRSSDDSPQAQGAGIARMLDKVPGKKVIIADVPFPSINVPSCLAKHIKDVRACAVARYRRTEGGSPAREKVAAKLSGATFVNFARTICGGPGECPVVGDGFIKYRDEHHLTAAYSRWLGPALDRALMKVVRSSK